MFTEVWKEYDEKGRELNYRRLSDDGDEYAIIQRKFDDNGNCIYEENNEGTKFWRIFNEEGKVIHFRSLDCDNVETQSDWKYDERGNMICYIDHANEFKVSNHYNYDERGNIIRITTTSSGFVGIDEKCYEYDDNNNLIHYQDSRRNEKWYSYDEKGRLVCTEFFHGGKELIEYDENNNPIHYIRINSHGKIFLHIFKEYDENNNLTHEYDTDGTISRYRYDENGNCIYRIDIESEV